MAYVVLHKEDTNVANNRQQSDQHTSTAGPQARRAEDQAPQRGAAAAERVDTDTGSTIRQGGEAGAEIVEETGQALAEATRRSTRVIAEAERELADEVADLVE